METMYHSLTFSEDDDSSTHTRNSLQHCFGQLGRTHPIFEFEHIRHAHTRTHHTHSKNALYLIRLLAIHTMSSLAVDNDGRIATTFFAETNIPNTYGSTRFGFNFCSRLNRLLSARVCVCVGVQFLHM